jgi:acetyl esterase/lipase
MRISSILGAAALSIATLSMTTMASSAEKKEVSDAKAQIAAIGKIWNADVGVKVRQIYDPIYAKYKDKTDKEVKVTRDVAYGSDEKQKLDVHLPTKKGTNRPIVIFFHGGGQTGGDKNGTSNIGDWAARQGFVGINANYRLSPQVKWPAQGQDVASVIAFAKSKAKEYGGDASRVYVWGQSAGGTIIANYLYQPDIQPNGDPGVAGAILMSGVYTTPHQGPRRDFSQNYYGEDEAKWDERAPMGQAKAYKGKRVPTLITNAQLNPDNIEFEGVDLNQVLCRNGGCPRYFQTIGHNHLSESSHLNTADQSVAPAILDFIKSTASAGSMKMAAAK